MHKYLIIRYHYSNDRTPGLLISWTTPIHLFSLMSRKFGVYMMLLLLVSAPVFYFIVVGYYAEDLNRVATMAHVPSSQLDLERDSLMGLILQISMFVLLLVCSFVVMRVLPKKVVAAYRQVNL